MTAATGPAQAAPDIGTPSVEADKVPLGRQLAAIMNRDPDRPSVEYQRRVYTKGEYAALADRAIALLDEKRVEPRQSIGIVVRNRPLHAAVMLGLIAQDRGFSSIYAFQSAEAIARELEEERFAAVFADADDWTGPVLEAARAAGTIAIRLDHEPLGQPESTTITPINGLDQLGPGPFREVPGEPGLEILSSGTTGKPKRILFPTRMLVRTVDSVMFGLAGGPIDPDILTWPYAGISGICNLVASAMLERYTVLLERFNIPEWVEAVERLRPSSMSGMPTMARMILDAGVPKEKLASIRRFYGGSAPMTPELQTEFERTYDIDVIWAYGATEFCGSVISWTPALYAEFRSSKLGSIGRALPAIGLRVVDTDTGQILGPGQEGFLQVRVPAIGDDWIGTTDIVLIDEDGFVFHKGRGDGAILRGGYKIIPEKVADALRAHPAVLDAAVIGRPDERLGAVPVAAVELRAGAAAPAPEDLRAFVKRTLIAPQVPTEIIILPALPRTTSLKTDLRGVAAAFDALAASSTNGTPA